MIIFRILIINNVICIQNYFHIKERGYFVNFHKWNKWNKIKYQLQKNVLWLNLSKILVEDK